MKLWQKATTLTAVIAALVAGGCGDDETRTRWVYRDPLFARYEAMNNDGRYVVLEEEDVDTGLSSLLSFDTQDEDHDMMVEDTPDKQYRFRGTIGNKAILAEYNKDEPNDIVVFDLETCVKLFDSDSPLVDEWFRCITGNGKAIINGYNLFTHNDSVFEYDPQTNTLTDLFPSDNEASVFSDSDEAVQLITVEDFLGEHQVYTLDVATGDINQLLDLTGEFPYAFYWSSNQNAVVYRSGSDIVFNQPGGLITRFADPTNDHGVVEASSDGSQAIVEDFNLEKYFHLNLDVGVRQEIDFSVLGGWEPYGWGGFNLGQDKVMIEGRDMGAGLPDVLFYDPLTNSLEDLITPLLAPTGVIEDCDIDARYKGKALIELEVETTDDWYDTVLLFDGTGLSSPFSSYERSFVTEESRDGRYALIEAINIDGSSDLIHFDMETQAQKVVATTDNYFSGETFSKDGTKIAYTTREPVNWNDVLNVYDLATDTTKTDLATSSDIDIMEFSQDNSKLAIVKGQIDEQLHILDINTLEQTFICHY